mgnify:CR=1 FL=1
MWTKFEKGRSRRYQVIDSKRPTCAKQYALSSSKRDIMKHLFCNALVHVIYSVVSWHYSYTIHHTIYLSMLEFRLDFSNKPIKRFIGQPELFNDSLRTECGSDKHFHQDSSVLIGLDTEPVFSRYNSETLTQMLHIYNSNKSQNDSMLGLICVI